MRALPSYLRVATDPIAPPESVIRGDHHRITILTPRLLRLEWSASGAFEDRATQVVLDRNFPPCDFEVRESPDRLEVDTPYVQLRYDRRRFSAAGLSARVVGIRDHHVVWRYGAELPVVGADGATVGGHAIGGSNLGGTARTLDLVDGPIALGAGLLSKPGWSVLDDSERLALADDGWVAPRVGEPGDVDLYLFAYGDDAEACLRDFYHLTGPQPLLPRFAFGNWWSRYHVYTDGEYRELFERFERERLPFSVAVLDMDWHLTDVADADGWTGYTWNRDLFPDPPALLAWLHDRGLQVTLNVHPADGVLPHEERYGAMAAALGVAADGRGIDFDIGDPAFAEAYLEVLHHPLEAEGVDFWWIDWQQGEWSGVPGLDPLWMLNHLHFLDRGRDGRRPLTFSRYAGIGSHRYPVGFSGDAVVSWASLEFQPYFTAAASNVGYGWWSHDIGGHMFGTKDDELATRWVEYGVFSPILRLHSTDDVFNSKEPWRFAPEHERVMGEWLRFRHRLVPYLYTMNERAHRGVPLVRPMHHTHRRRETLESPNAYWFGDLVAAPITSRLDPSTQLAASTAWLPPGVWVDLFTGVAYGGDRTVRFHRPLDGVPVLARPGTIVPLTGGDELGVENPRHIELWVVAGGDGEFTMYEDDDAAEPRAVRTTFGLDAATGTLTIAGADGDVAVVPSTRRYTVTVIGGSSHGDAATVEVGDVDTATGATVDLGDRLRLREHHPAALIWHLLDRARIEFATKRRIDEITGSDDPPDRQLSRLVALDLEPALLSAVAELVAPDRRGSERPPGRAGT